MLSIVVFPAPDGPITASTRPPSTIADTSERSLRSLVCTRHIILANGGTGLPVRVTVRLYEQRRKESSTASGLRPAADSESAGGTGSVGGCVPAEADCCEPELPSGHGTPSVMATSPATSRRTASFSAKATTSSRFCASASLLKLYPTEENIGERRSRRSACQRPTPRSSLPKRARSRAAIFRFAAGPLKVTADPCWTQDHWV
eukprot:scaffold14458_cov107-Isochrysis_galbana.AAC.3